MSGIPYNEVEGLIILALASVLLIGVILISRMSKLEIGREFTFALIKGGFQLFIVAIVLTYVFRSEIWFIWIWFIIAAMALVGGYTSAKRASGMPNAFLVTTPSILIGAVPVLFVLAVTGAMPLAPQFIIPLAGMVFGNSMITCSLTLDRLIREVKLNINLIETALALGAKGRDAIEACDKISIRSALIPVIDRLKTVGIIFIPGAMAGLLMAGTHPIVAAEYQIIVYLMIVGSGIITAVVSAHLARRYIFTKAEQIAHWI